MHPLQHPAFHLVSFWAHFKAYSAMVGLTAKETEGFVVMCQGGTAENGEVGHGQGSAAPLPCPALCHLPSPKPSARLDGSCPRPASPAAHPGNPSLLAKSLHPTWCRKKKKKSQLPNSSGIFQKLRELRNTPNLGPAADTFAQDISSSV